jgi:hypothetical protein
MNSACASGTGSLASRMRETGSRNACRSPSSVGSVIFTQHVDVGASRSSGLVTSPALTMAIAVVASGLVSRW